MSVFFLLKVQTEKYSWYKKYGENRKVSFQLLDVIFHMFHVDVTQENSLLNFQRANLRLHFREIIINWSEMLQQKL